MHGSRKRRQPLEDGMLLDMSVTVATDQNHEKRDVRRQLTFVTKAPRISRDIHQGCRRLHRAFATN